MLGVFTWLGQYLYQALRFVVQFLEQIFGPVLARMIPVLCPILYGVYWVVSNVSAWINEAEGWLSSIHIPATNLTGLSAFAVANTFFPLSESMALLSVYLTAVLALTCYRFVKSLIPTLS
jgi:hypothetical protein